MRTILYQWTSKAVMTLAVFLCVPFLLGTAHAAGNILVDGGSVAGQSFTGLANINSTCYWAGDLFTDFGGSSAIDCIEAGTRVLTDGEVVTKPIILFGNAILEIAAGAHVTFESSTTSPLPPFVYVGGAASIQAQHGGTLTSTGAAAYNRYFIYFRGSGSSVFTDVVFDGGGMRSAVAPTDPSCNLAIDDFQEADLKSSIVNIHQDQDDAGIVSFTNVVFRNAQLGALYGARRTTLDNVAFEDNVFGIVRDNRAGNLFVTEVGTTFSSNSIADEASIVVAPASTVGGDGSVEVTALSCSETVVTPSVPTAVLTVTDGVETDSGVTHPTVIVSLEDENGAPVTATADITFELVFTDAAAQGGDSTAPDADFDNAAGQTLTVAAGASASAAATVTIFSDTLFEGDETFDVAVTTPDATIDVTTAQATVTIADATTLTATLTSETVDESTGTVPFLLELDQTNATGAPLDFLVTLGDAADTATAGADYLDNGGSVTLRVVDGADTATYNVTVQTNDGELEADETVTATASVAAGTAADIAVRIAFDDAATHGTIHDDTPVTAALLVLQDGVEGSAEITVQVQLSERNMTGEALNFDLTVTGGTATVDEDYSSATLGMITVPDNASSGTTTVLVTDDTDLEITETAEMTLTLPVTGHENITIDPDNSVVTAQIVDNDTADATIAVLAHGAEGIVPTDVAFTIALAQINATDAPITFDLALDGTATAGDDYTDIVSGNATVAVADGAQTATITLPVIDDTLYEGDETLRATISNVSDSAVTIGTASAIATITDDDLPALTADVSVTQNGAEATPTDIIYTVTLSGTNVTGAPITFDTTFTGGLAVAGDDYGSSVAGSATLSVPVGGTTGALTVPVVNDDALEGEETVELTISNASHDSVTISTAQATATITDDESALVAEANDERDKDREDSKKKKKKVTDAVVAAVSAPVRTVTGAVEPFIEEHTEVIPVAQTDEEIRPLPDENTLVWNRTRDVRSPQVLGAETQTEEASDTFMTRWWIPLLILLAVIIGLITYYALKGVRDKQEHVVTRNTESW